MSAEFIRKQKPVLIKVLSPETLFVLQYVDSEDIIPHGFYTDLLQIGKNECTIIRLLDRLIENENNSTKFLKLLEVKEFQDNFPGLKDIIKNQGKNSSINLLGIKAIQYICFS